LPNPHPQELRHLPALHYALAGVLALVTLGLLGPILSGWGALAHPERHVSLVSGDALGPASGGMWIFLLLGSGTILYGAVLSVAVALTGRAIARRRSHGFCIATSVLSTFFFPLGTLLGFHTINALCSPDSRVAFGLAPPDAAGTRAPPA
jgi:hypothetical protein